MNEEELRGPIELTETKKKESKDDSDSNEDENEEGIFFNLNILVYQIIF